jgi:NAD(P)-dependent dehydrogenase (short-subunit alcohol dehydrogenase family)
MEVDVTKRGSVDVLANRIDAELGGASVLVNNAGIMPLTPVIEAEEDAWRWIVDVNFFGVLYGIQTFVPRMLASGNESHVVNTASFAGFISGAPAPGNRIALGERVPADAMWHHGYTATKAAVVALTETLCGELVGTRVGVSVLVPGAHHGGQLLQNSTVNRPAEYGGPVDLAKAMAALAGRREQASTTDDAPPPGGYPRDPEMLAKRVVRAIRESHFYIFTHPENRGPIEERFTQISAGFDDCDSYGG